MSSKIYVGNLSYSTSEGRLQDLFSQFGEVFSVAIIKDKFTQQSKGFGFIEMDGAENAIAQLNDTVLDGRNIRASVAHDKPRRY